MIDTQNNTIVDTKTNTETSSNNDEKTYHVFNEKWIEGRALQIHKKNVMKFNNAKYDLESNSKKSAERRLKERLDKSRKWMKNWMIECSEIYTPNDVQIEEGDIVLGEVSTEYTSLSNGEVNAFNKAFIADRNNHKNG